MKTLLNNWRLCDPASTDGAAGGGPAPAAGDSPAPDSGDDSLFSDIATHDEMEPTVPDTGAPAAPTPPAPVSTPAAAVSPPAATAVAPPAGLPSQPATPPVAPTSAAQPPGSPAAPGSQQPDASGNPTPATPAPFDAAKHREEFLPKLQEHYKLDEADVEAFRTDPGKVIPTLAARLHYDVQSAVFAGVMNALPQMLQHYTEQQRVHTENETEFFSAFPSLKEKPEYAQTVVNSIAAIRTANPSISRAELIKQAGIMASMTLGLPIGAPAPSAPPPPAARTITANARPAGAGTIGHVPSPTPPGQTQELSDLDELVNAHLAGEI